VIISRRDKVAPLNRSFLSTFRLVIGTLERSFLREEGKATEATVNRKNRFLTIASGYSAGTKQKVEDETSDIRQRSAGRGEERHTNHHKNLPANLSAPDEEASPEVGQPKKASIELGKRNR